MQENQLIIQGAGLVLNIPNIITDLRSEIAELIKSLVNTIVANRNIVQDLIETDTKMIRNWMEANCKLVEVLITIDTLQVEGNG